MLRAGFASWAGAPIASADGGVQGMLAIFGRQPRRLRDDEVEALAAFANSASVALRNALLYEAVASEKDRVAAILGRVADAIVATDAEGRIVLWNAAAEQITQIPERRALGRVLAELLTSELGDGDGSAHGVLAGAGAIATEVRLSRAGQELWLSVTAADMSGGDGRPGRVLAMRDISEVRALEQLKSDFVATVSHELRTPLTSIYGFAETLLREDASVRRGGSRVVRALHRERDRAAQPARRVAAQRRAPRDGRRRAAAHARSTSRRSRATSRRGPARAPSSTSSRSCCPRAARSPRPTPTACARC